ncbi:MAG: GAF domain-containing protein [Limisphaerales bacterium]
MEVGTGLKDVLITDQLERRCFRAPNLTAENQAMHDLAQHLSDPAPKSLKRLLQTGMQLCEAGTAGISLLETNPEQGQIFRWIALAGKLEMHVGGWTPRDHSPCGVTLDQCEPQLFSWPERYFEYFAGVQPPIVEGLVVPFFDGEVPWGTIWIVSHNEKTSFDIEDVRLLRSLSGFTSAILRLMGYTSAPEGSPWSDHHQLQLSLS